MGMGLPMDGLSRVVNTLEKTWKAWFHCRDGKTKRQLEENFEYLLRELNTFSGFVREEWRSAFPKPPRNPKYDDNLQWRLVDKER